MRVKIAGNGEIQNIPYQLHLVARLLPVLSRAAFSPTYSEKLSVCYTLVGRQLIQRPGFLRLSGESPARISGGVAPYIRLAIASIEFSFV